MLPAWRALILLSALMLTGCQQSQKRQITIRFWNGFTGPDGRTMLRIVRQFNEANPDVKVVMQRMDWATYYNKLFVAGLGHRAPEVFVIHTRAMDRFARAGFLRPVDDLMAGPNGIPVSDIDANVWAANRFGGKHYSLPLDVHVLGMYYNKRLFREAGLVDKAGEPLLPKTRAEFVNAIRRISGPATNGERKAWGFVFTYLETNVYTIMCQFGGKFFTPDGSKCLLNDPRNVEALQFCADLIQKERLVPSPENFDSWIGFRQGRIGMAFEGVYMLADLQKQTDLDFSGAPVPQIGIVKKVWADSHNLCLRGDLSGAQLDAAWRFEKFLSEHSLDWAEGGQVPVRKSMRNTPRFRAMKVQYEFSKQIPYVAYLPRLPFVFEFQTEFDTAIEAALRGSVSPKQALDTATTNINKIIARERAAEAERRGQP